jgi:hypothetical protein
MSAVEGMRCLNEYGIQPDFLSSFRQNLYALGKRLNLDPVYLVDMNQPKEMSNIATQLIYKLIPKYNQVRPSLAERKPERGWQR